MGAQQPLIVHLDSVELATEVSGIAQRDALRRVRTLLLIDSSKTRHGGGGRAIEAFNCYGERLCIKCMLPLGRIRLRASREKIRQLVEGREAAFESEYLCHRVVSGLPGFPRLLCRGSYAGGPVMLMEWVEGVSLYDIRDLWPSRAAGGFSKATCAALGLNIVKALQMARGRDALFVHRDISSKNVILRTQRTPLARQFSSHRFDLCLIDFGSSVCSCVREPEDDCGTEPRVWKSATPEYAPPEMLIHSIPQLRAARLQESVDVYELCSLLYEFYSGRLPYEIAGRGIAETFRLKAEYIPRKLPARRPDDQEFCDTVMAGIRPKPHERLGFSELQKALERCR